MGCGACAYICPSNNIVLQNFYDQGIRPVSVGKCQQCGKCLQVCAGINNTQYNHHSNALNDLRQYIGNALEIWEGYSTDEEIRFNASSGGIATALAMYCIDFGLAEGVLQTKADLEKPFLNKIVYSQDVRSVKSCSGSRYSPSSPCARLSLIEKSNGKSVFIGKPCDVSSLRNAQKLKPELSDKIALTIGIFCAGTPSTKATLELIEKHGLNADELEELRYRGNGWPGTFFSRSKSKLPIELPYIQSWSFIQKYRPLRCYLCADGTSETADLSCGDAWYLRDVDKKGVSLIIIRNEKGRKIFHEAIDKGYIYAYPSQVNNVIISQQSLFGRQKEQWGRFAVYKLCGIPVPKYIGWSLLKNWFAISSKAKLRSIISTLKRVLQRKLFLPAKNDVQLNCDHIAANQEIEAYSEIKGL